MLVPRERAAGGGGDRRCGGRALTVGDPFDGDLSPRPARSDAQRERVRDYIRKGEAEGAKLVTGGAEPPEGLDTGYYVQPTVFSEVTPEMTIAQEEIFGPVLAIMPYDDEDDAVRIANDSQYGLAGGVWSGDEERAKRVARRMRTGQVDINGSGLQPAGAVRRLQAVRPRPRAGPVRHRGVPRGEVDSAVGITGTERMRDSPRGSRSAGDLSRQHHGRDGKSRLPVGQWSSDAHILRRFPAERPTPYRCGRSDRGGVLGRESGASIGRRVVCRSNRTGGCRGGLRAKPGRGYPRRGDPSRTTWLPRAKRTCSPRSGFKAAA